MRLIEIAAIQGDLDPFDALAAFHEIEGLLKTADPAKHLGREPGFIAEGLDESLGAQSDLVRHARYGGRMRFSHAPAQGESDRAVRVAPPGAP